MDILYLVRQYLNDNYSNQSALSGEQLSALLHFASAGVGRSIGFVVDPNRRETLWSRGSDDHLHVPPPKWDQDRFEAMIPEPYRACFFRMDESFRYAYFRDRLGRYGHSLLLVRSFPIADALGNYHHATMNTCPFVIDNTGDRVILLLMEIRLHHRWEFQQPIDFRPMLFNGKEHLHGYEEKIVQRVSMLDILDDLMIKEEWHPVFRCHFQGVESNEQIAKAVECPLSKVNYYNLKILERLRPFSHSFRTAREGVDFLKAQNLVF